MRISDWSSDVCSSDLQEFDIPFPSQRYGTVPDSAWKLKKYHTKWTVADSINASIGQGYVLANPLQLAVMAARLGSGRKVVPRMIIDQPPGAAPELAFDPQHLAIVRDAMYAAVNDGGTAGAARLYLPAIEPPAKTGTPPVRRPTLPDPRP